MTAVGERARIPRPQGWSFNSRLRSVAAALVANALAVILVLGFADVHPLVPLAVVIGLPLLVLMAVALAARPQRGILLLVALLPLDGLRAVIPFPAGWKEALVLLTLAATFVAPVESRGRAGRPLPRWTVAAGALIVLGVASAMVVGGTDGAVALKVGFFYVLATVAIWRCPLDFRDRDRLVSILVAMGIATAIFGIAQQILGHERLAELGWAYNDNIRFAGGYLRSFSTFNQNFPFSLFLMLVVLVALPCAIEQPRRFRSQVFFLGLPVIAIAMLMTVTRGGWLGLAAGLIYLGVTRYRQVAAAVVHAVVIGTVALLVVGSYSSAFLSQSSSEERFDIWRQNVADVAKHPLGSGIGTTGAAGEKVQEVAGTEEDEDVEVLEPDNQYFKFAFDLGVLGLWLFVLLLLGAFTAVHRIARVVRGTDGALVSGIAASIVAAAVVSIIASYFEIFPMDAYFWILVGVAATCLPESR